MTGKQLDTTFVRENTQKKKNHSLSLHLMMLGLELFVWSLIVFSSTLVSFFFYVCFLCCSCANFFFFVLYGANKIHVFAGSFLNSFFTRERVWLFAGCFSFVRVAAENALPPFTHTQGTVKVQFFFFSRLFRKKTRKEPHFAFFGAIWATDTLTHTYTRARKETSIEKEKKKKY